MESAHMKTFEEWSKIGRSSRSRGHAFERLIAKKLNPLLGSKFVRTPCSGGHAIEADLYEAPGEQTKWSKFKFFCRTGCAFNWAALICGKEVGPLKWIKDEDTGEGSIWIFRSGVGQFLACVSRKFVKEDALTIDILLVGDWCIFDIKLLNDLIIFD